MKDIEYSIVVNQEINELENKLISLYWEVYFDHYDRVFKFYNTIDEILIAVNLQASFPIDNIVTQKSSIIILSPEFSCSVCKKPLCINSRNLYLKLKKTCDSCEIDNINLIVKGLFDKIEIYNNKVKKKLKVVLDELTYLDKIFILAICDNILLDDFGKLERNDCESFWTKNYCQNNKFFEDLFHKEILIEIDEEMFGYLRLLDEINSIDFNYVNENVRNYLNYLWSKKMKFGIYLNFPNEFYSHEVWVNTIRSYVNFKKLQNKDVEPLYEFYSYIRYRESLIVINSFLSRENIDIKKDNNFYSAINFFILNFSLFDLVFLLEQELNFEVENFKKIKLKSENWFDCTLNEIKELIVSNVEL